MQEIGFLGDLIVIFGVSVIVVLILHRLRFPTITGFLLSGMLLGPHGLSLVSDRSRIEVLAEVGVMLLLFTIGVEFSLAMLRRHWGTAVAGALLPIPIWALLGAIGSPVLGLPRGAGVFLGFLVALSSTVIPLKALADRGQVDSPQGRAATGVAVFQDLLVIPMMLLTPYLAPGLGSGGLAGRDWAAPAIALIGSVVGIGVFLLVALKGVPRLLKALTALRSREVFVISIFLLCLGTAWVTSRAGLSLALGAFLAGLVVSESEYGHQALADMMPFRDSLTSLFFVSVGMLIDPGVLLDRPLLVACCAAGILLVKPVLIGGCLLLSGMRPAAALQAGVALAQVGEFALVLMTFGSDHGLLPDRVEQIFLASAVVTMAVTPPLIAGVARLLPALTAWEDRGWWRVSQDRAPQAGPPLTDHVIIVGYGFNGRNLARVLAEIGIPYVALDLNARTVRDARSSGESILYGDAVSAGMLERVGAARARALVMAISDPVSTRRACAVARREYPALHLIVRTRYLTEVDDLYALGAQVVIPEEVETSMEIFAQVLRHYGVPREALVKHARRIRAERYGLFRGGRPAGGSPVGEAPALGLRPPAAEVPPEGPAPPGVAGGSPGLGGLHPYLASVEVRLCTLTENAAGSGRTLRDLALRGTTGATVIALMRDGRVQTNPPADLRLEPRDAVVLIGNPEQIGAALAAIGREGGG